MRQLALIAFMSLIMSSCGILFDGDVMNGDSRQFDSTNPTFLKYVDSFETHAKTIIQDEDFFVGDIPINFGDTKKDEYDGVCIKYANGEREILMKKSWWDTATDKQKEILVYHELGHCRLNRSHDNHILHSTKTSIMNPVVPDEVSYSNFKLEYLTELYTSNKQSLLDALSI